MYRQIVGIPTGTIYAPFTADLFLYGYERDFMSQLYKPTRLDLIDMFNDISCRDKICQVIGLGRIFPPFFYLVYSSYLHWNIPLREAWGTPVRVSKICNIHDEACRVVDVAKLGHEDGISSSLSQCGD